MLAFEGLATTWKTHEILTSANALKYSSWQNQGLSTRDTLILRAQH